MLYQRIRIAFLISITSLMWGDGFSQNWQQVGDGMGCSPAPYIWDISISQDSSNLFISGLFTEDGSCNPMTAVAKWDGFNYYLVAIPFTGSESTLAFEFQGEQYCSGHLSDEIPNGFVNNYLNINNSGMWDTVPNTGIEGALTDYRIKDDKVYLSGSLQYCGDIPCGLVCTFDGTLVSPYYTETPIDSYALDLEFYHDTLFVAGAYNSAQSSQALNGYSKLCKIVDGNLNKVGDGFTLGGMGTSTQVFQDRLYIGGWLQRFNESGFHSIQYYENGHVQILAEEPDDLIYAMKVYNGGLYVAGDFHNIGTMPCEHVARWDGESWTCLCNDPFYFLEDELCDGQCIKDIEIWNDTLYVAGFFNRIGNTEAKRIAKLDMNLSEAFPVKITEFNSELIRVSPNPASDHITIQGIPASLSYSVCITDMTGRTIRAESNKSKIDIRELPTGMYLVSIDFNQGRIVKRFLKE